MGNLNFSLGKVQYDNLSLSTFPLEAQIGVGVGASIVALIVLIIVLIYRSVTALWVCVICTAAHHQGAMEMHWRFTLRLFSASVLCAVAHFHLIITLKAQNTFK